MSEKQPSLTTTEPTGTQNPKRKNQIKWAIRVGGTLFLLFFLLRLNLDFGKIAQDLSKANLWWIALSVVLVLPFIALKAWRWQVILHDLGLKISFGEAYRLYAIGLSAGSFTPGQAGDAIKAFYLHEKGFSLGSGLVSVVLDRLFDLAVLVLLAVSGLIFLGNAFKGDLPVLLLLLGGTLAGLVVLAIPRTRQFLLDLALKVFMRRKTTAQTTRQEETKAVETLRPVNLIPVFGVTIAASLLALFRVWLLAISIGLNLNPLEVVAISSLATVAGLVPISVGGIGARDVVLVGILSRLGYLAEKAVSLSTLILLLNLVNLLAGYLIWQGSGKERGARNEE
jgi:glycosyltransferase 2 family protein